MNRQLARYLPAPILLNLGLFIHVLLFNLYLADRGFREDAMGRQAALMTIGTASGTLLGAAMVRRWGLRVVGVAACSALAVAMLLRPQAEGAWLGAASVTLGICLGTWLVTNTPAIAALSVDSGGFSLNIGFSIAIGVVGGFLGGRLPGWLAHFLPLASSVELKRAALMFAALPIACAAVAVARISFPRPAPGPRASARFLLRYLPAVAVWYVFCAGFIPFFNVYLHNRLGASTATIGNAYALAHLPQAAAILLMPLIIARFGVVRSVVTTQVLASLGVLAMLYAATLTQAAAFYMLYMSLQVMSEPGLQNLLMRGVPEGERPSAMAANLLLLFGINASVSLGAGWLIVQHGYSTLFIALSVIGLAAAATFAFVFRQASPRDIDPAPSAFHN